MIKVAGYCRVSTDGEDQANSFRSQKAFFRDYIAGHWDWELQEIYADEGITGTSRKKRREFNRMMNDACEGKFQLILTKEVSRFSRNILDTIACTRELKAMGIGVLFLTDGINTLDPEAEMLLSFLSSLAQEESRRTSARVVWGQTRQMEKGVVFGRSLLGYDVKDGKLTVNPEGAELVRLIFHKYAAEQISTAEIARFLTREGFRTHGGSNQWKPSTVIKILKNEKYVGDLVQKKTYTPDYLTHEKKSNNGAVPKIILRDHHEPIVSREIWNMARERLKRNNKHTPEGGHSNRYAFSGKIKCGQCGKRFVARVRKRKDGSFLRRWSCTAAAREGTRGCDVGKLLRDDDALQMLQMAVRSLCLDLEELIREVTELSMSAALAAQEAAGEEPGRIQREINRVRQKKEAVMEAYFSREIPKEDMVFFGQKYDRQVCCLEKRLEEARIRAENGEDAASLRQRLHRELSGIVLGETESEVFCKTMVESITVFKDRHMELRLKGLPQVFHFSG